MDRLQQRVSIGIIKHRERRPMSDSSVKCGNCGRPLDEDRNEPNRQPCEECGSITRTVKRAASDEAEFKERLGLKVKDPLLTGRNKFRVEQVCGDELRRASGTWVKKVRVIDRENDKYLEVVTDPVTGEIVHRCDEPLSEHFGHGSAKKSTES